MKFGSITGDATQSIGDKTLINDPAFLKEQGWKQGWINISYFKWSIDRTITTRSGLQGNARDPKQPIIHDITVKKEVDSATSQLLDAICYKNKAETCTVIFVKTGNPSKLYMQYKLSNAFITKIDIDLVQEQIVETLTINFTKVEMAHLSGDTTNVLSQSDPDRFEFELKQTAHAGAGHSPGGPH
jgi:type VI secretion system Hcp family effector